MLTKLKSLLIVIKSRRNEKTDSCCLIPSKCEQFSSGAFAKWKMDAYTL